MSAKNIEDVYPLSPMQEGLLFHSLYQPEAGQYVTQIPYECQGIDISALRRAWQLIIDRHSIFRTAFVWKNSEKPMQVVGRRVELPFKIEDWRQLSVEDQETSFTSYLQEDRTRGFQLNKAPLLRIVLFQTGDNAYRFLLSHHHILMDGWSTALVFGEAFKAYEAFCKGQEPELEPAKPFRNYIAWLQQQDLNAAETFWRENLKGFTAPTPLVLDSTPGRQLSTELEFAEEVMPLPPALFNGLQSFARKHQLTISTIVQGVWALLLSRYSGELDVAFGSIVSGRPTSLPDVEKMIGLFINNLTTRIKIPTQANVVKWMQDIQDQQVELRQYEHTPLTKVQAWSEVPNGESLFDSIVSVQNFPVEAELARASQEFKSIHTVETDIFRLTLVIAVGQQLVMTLRYDRRSFDAATAARIAGHLRSLLEDIVANPWKNVSDLSLLTSEEKELFIKQWSHSEGVLPSDLSIAELFEAQVRQAPQAIALIAGEQEITYEELNRRANQLAHYLRRLGVGPEVAVGLCVRRSVEMVVGLLGILKAGGAYVPLDAEYPAERLQYMLADSEVRVLLAEDAAVTAFADYQGAVLKLGTAAKMLEFESAENPVAATSGKNLAYIMYTSGSTGQPKGVSIEQRGVVRLVKDTNYARFSAAEVYLQLAPTSFDASIFEIWGALLNGARLVLMPPETPSLQTLAEVIQQHRVSTIFVTTGLFNVLVDEQLQDLHTLKQVLTGGEAASVAHMRKAYRQLGEGSLIHVYGPTESTTFASYHAVTEQSLSGATVPIGYPVANTEIYLLDPQLRPVPIGVAGEIYIGGAGLAREYLHSPALTAEKFVSHPFSDEPGARLYATGDLARFLPDGSIDFLGRRDKQVKIRGFRIELSEIEGVLDRHEKVREVAVVAEALGEGEGKQLVAYIVPASGVSLSAAELRDHVINSLPEYMLPGAFIFVDRFPLTPNGKLDVKALSLAKETQRDSEDAYVAPLNAVEQTIAGIWSQLLGVERIGSNDSFFFIGGNSIFAIQLISRLNKTYNLELPLRTIYDKPQLSDLAAHIIKLQAEQADAAELNELLAELEDISEADARTMLAGQAD
ncbi:MAG TPA: amino acid adenylation domain-containing protein [Pyrinomonadaceae bacterium]